MKCDPHFIGVIVLNTVFSISTSTGWLTAVSSSVTISELYTATRNRQSTNSTSMNKKPLDTTNKKDVCYFIGSSGYFGMRGYNPVDMPSVLLESETIDVLVVHTRKTVREDVFPCIVVSRAGNDTTAFKFYISGEYDLAYSSVVVQTPRTVGRFLFVYENDVFYCDALAEEPARAYSRPEYNVEQLYLKVKSDREIAHNRSVDPLCELNIENKLRLCTIVMNSNSIVSQGIRFFPHVQNVRAVCERKRVREMRNAAQKIDHQEWMMACIARTSDNGQVEYYLSRAYDYGQVFVYKARDEETGDMVLENLSWNVPLVMDSKMQPSPSDKSCTIC